jgi:hypothetical protein
MSSFLDIGLPILTLLIGYGLNVATNIITKSKEDSQRRRAEREKGYKKISEQLHVLFEEIRIQTLNNSIAIDTGDHTVTIRLIERVKTEFDKLQAIVFRSSFYLSDKFIERLMDLRIRYVRRHSDIQSAITKIEQIKSNESNAEALWTDAKAIMNDMRKEFKLSPYSSKSLDYWR